MFIQASDSYRTSSPYTVVNTATEMWVYIIKPRKMHYEYPSTEQQKFDQGFRLTWDSSFTP